MSCPTQQPKDLSQACGSVGFPPTAHPENISLTLLIPDHRVWGLQKELKAVSRSLRARGFRKIEMRQGCVVEQPHPDGTITRFVEVTLSVPSPVLGDWLVVGKSKGGQVTDFSTGGALPDDASGGMTCDACGGKRSSKVLYLLKSPDGEIRRVEASCLPSFTGHADPLPVVRLAETLGSLPERGAKFATDNWAGRGRGVGRLIRAEDFLAHAAAAARAFGYTSRADAQGEFLSADLSTAEMALQGMIGKLPMMGWQPAEEDYQFAREALRWVREELAQKVTPYSENSYQVDLVSLLREDAFSAGRIGLAASLIPTFQKVLERRRKEIEASGSSQHVGTVGERMEFAGLKLTAVIPKEKDIRTGWRTMHTTTYIHKFTDSDGNLLVWFASSNELPVGRVYQGRATIKNHEEFRGIKQTILTRCDFAPQE